MSQGDASSVITAATAAGFDKLQDHQLLASLLASQVSASIIKSTSAFNRPNDNVPYGVGDVVSSNVTPGSASNMVFPNCAPYPGGSGVIKRAVFFTDNPAYAGKTFALNLFTVNLTSFGDNNPFNVQVADRLYNLGPVLTLAPQSLAASLYGGGSNCFIFLITGLYVPFICAPGDSSLYGVLTINGGTTPAQSSLFAIDLYIGLQ